MNLPELEIDLETTFQTYLMALESYSEENFQFKKSPEIWSLAQMYQHLLESAQFFFLANTKRCLDKRKGELDQPQTDLATKVFQYNSLPPTKFKRPVQLSSPEPTPQNISYYKAQLVDVINSIKQVMEEVAADDSLYKTMNPVFGYLNAYEWLWMMAIHARHHFRQKGELESYFYS